LILALRPLLGSDGAEAAALVLWPTLLFGAALLLVAANARRMTDGANRHVAPLAGMTLAALSAPALIHFRSGAIDHHNVQMVLLLCFLFCLGYRAKPSQCRSCGALGSVVSGGRARDAAGDCRCVRRDNRTFDLARQGRVTSDCRVRRGADRLVGAARSAPAVPRTPSACRCAMGSERQLCC
jgi:hypothetical protein